VEELRKEQDKTAREEARKDEVLRLLGEIAESAGRNWRRARTAQEGRRQAPSFITECRLSCGAARAVRRVLPPLLLPA
jgi:hypothetical protein